MRRKVKGSERKRGKGKTVIKNEKSEKKKLRRKENNRK